MQARNLRGVASFRSWVQPRPGSQEHRMDMARIADAHARLFEWLIAGGDAASARPWLRELFPVPAPRVAVQV